MRQARLVRSDGGAARTRKVARQTRLAEIITRRFPKSQGRPTPPTPRAGDQVPDGLAQSLSGWVAGRRLPSMAGGAEGTADGSSHHLRGIQRGVGAALEAPEERQNAEGVDSLVRRPREVDRSPALPP